MGLVQAVLPASVWNMCKRMIEVPQELGRSCCFLGNIPDGDTGLPTPGLGSSLVCRGAKENECNRGIAKRRKRSAARWVAGSHSVLIVPLKLANFTLLEPVEESETSNHGTVFEKHDECLEIR
ncbi:hypothetical protein Pla144_44560 [Bythopirellula polymerisocia]|uniref:Uncharacterized protein n=1 Tax=Bythopirellula polymerisocia TaxID=2528003 RepID=A0A5C6CCD6_9BACT|nr:hypothetical protein Pla144_44560 [Bythopirellula polymerisocia]